MEYSEDDLLEGLDGSEWMWDIQIGGLSLESEEGYSEFQYPEEKLIGFKSGKENSHFGESYGKEIEIYYYPGEIETSSSLNSRSGRTYIEKAKDALISHLRSELEKINSDKSQEIKEEIRAINNLTLNPWG